MSSLLFGVGGGGSKSGPISAGCRSTKTTTIKQVHALSSWPLIVLITLRIDFIAHGEVHCDHRRRHYWRLNSVSTHETPLSRDIEPKPLSK